VRPGHVLVGARSHRESLHDLTPDEAADVLRLANEVATAVVGFLGLEKTYVAAIGDRDKHFHVHLLPKAATDPGLGQFVFGEDGWISFLPPSPDSLEVERVATAVRRALES
jgi:diadenosine tetraphosphate (Ap4A) HIT family hydrolase